MALLDRLRPQPGWKHPDPAIRLAAVESLPATEQALFASLAREDDAPRVRRAAVARLDDPDLLGTIARGDADDHVKADAIARLTTLAVDGGDAAIGRRAVAGLGEERHLSVVARSAAPEEVCAAALERIAEAKALGHVARHAEHEAIRLAALGRLNDRAEIEAVATRTEHKDVGLAALERLEDTAVLDGIALRAKNKVVARRAKAIVKDRAAADAETRAAAEALGRRRGQLADALEGLLKTRDRVRLAADLQRLDDEWRALGGAPDESETRWVRGTERARMHIEDLARQEAADAERRTAIGDAVARRRALIDAAQAADGADLAERLAALRAEWAMLNPVDADELKGLDGEFTRACAATESRAAARARVAAAQTRLLELTAEATQLAEAEHMDAARPRWASLAQEWREATTGLPIDAVAHAQYAAAAMRWHEREQAAREAAARSAAENQTRLQEIAERALALTTLPETPIKEIDRAVRELRSAIESPGPLPPGSEELIAKLKSTLTALSPRLREARETDEWRRWANAGIQEELCKRMEALRQVTDLVEVSRQLRDLRRQWKAVSVAPKDEADALWTRFKTAGDEIQARVDTHLATVVTEQNANLARKLALCEKAEALAQSTDWIATAETLKSLQAEWQTIGAVSKDQAAEVAKRFRTACDTFFTRRKTDLVQRKSEWAQNQQKKEALCARMEVLAESTDWAATFNEIKKLQAEWKTVGPVRRNKSEALWKRFRGACDKFFERYGKRHEIDLLKRVDEREAICRALEALAPGALAAAAAPAASQAEAVPESGVSAMGEADVAAPPVSAADDVAATAEVTDPAAVAASAPDVESAAADALAVESASEPVPSQEVEGASTTATLEASEPVAAPAASAATEASPQEAVEAREGAAAASASAADAGERAEAATPTAAPVVPEPVAAEPVAAAAPPTASVVPQPQPVVAAEPVAAAAPPEPPSRDVLVRAVEEAWKRWRQAPGLPSETLTPVRARFESALTTLLTAYPSAFQGTPFDLEHTRKRMKALCDEVESVTRGLPATQLGSTSVAALATLLKESLAANTIGGRVNEEAKARAAADRIRRAQSQWRELGPVFGTEGHQLEARFHRTVRRFFEQHPQLDQPHRDHRDHRDTRDRRDSRDQRDARDQRDQRDSRDQRGDRGSRGPQGPRPQGGPPRAGRTS